MGFIKYSVVELGIEEDVPGWVKQSKAAAEKASGFQPEPAEPEPEPANKNKEEQEEISTKDQ